MEKFEKQIEEDVKKIRKQNKKWVMPILIILAIIIVLVILMIKILPKGIEISIAKREENKIKQAFNTEAIFPENEKEIKDFQVGDSYSVILYEDGTVWIAGSNYYYDDEKIYGLQRNNFTKVNIENVSNIKVGNNFVLALTKNGEVYSWGGNDYGQLGRIASRIDDTPKKLDISNIKEIFVHEGQAAALDYDNNAYYWGYATNSIYNNKILKIENEKVSNIYLKDYQYFFKTESGKILGLGMRFDGVTDQINGWATKPVEFEIDNVKDIKSFGIENKSCIIKNDGTAYILDTKESKELKNIDTKLKINDIYYFGSTQEQEFDKTKYFLIDNNDNLYYNDQCILKNVDGLEKAKNVSGEADRVLILKKDGTIYNFGHSINNLARTGSYGTSPLYNLVNIEITNIKLMGITNYYAILIDKDNKIYRIGKNNKGGLGIGNEDEVAEDFKQTIENVTEYNTNNHSDNIENTNKTNDTQVYNSTTYQEEIENGKPYYYQFNNGETVLIDPAMSTMAD